MIQVFVSKVGRMDNAPSSYVVVLQEQGGTRVLPIWIGQMEAEAIVRRIHNVPVPRPLTHDLARSIISSLGARVRRVNITRVEDRTYYAEIELLCDDKLIRVDARPSDAIAIAVRFDAALFAAEELLLMPSEFDAEEEDADTELEFGSPAEPADVDGEGERMTDAKLNAEDLKRYLEALRPEDFGKFNP